MYQVLLLCVFCDRSGLINSTFSFDQQGGEKKSNWWPPQSGGSSLGQLQLHSQVHSHVARYGAVYCGSAHTSREQTELPQDTVKKKRKEKEKHQYFIKLLFLSGPDQSLDSHSPTGRDGSFVFAPQVEQQSDSVRFWKPCNAQPIHLAAYCTAFLKEEVKGRAETVRVKTCSTDVHGLNFLTLSCYFISCLCVCVGGVFTGCTIVKPMAKECFK